MEKILGRRVVKLFFEKLSFQESLEALYHCHFSRWDIAKTLKNCTINSFIQIKKHCFPERVIVLQSFFIGHAFLTAENPF